MKRPDRASAAQIARWAVLALAVACIAFGIARGEQIDVLQKAVTVCLECVGIA